MCRKMCVVILLCVVLFLAVSHVRSDNVEEEKKLEGKWAGTLCFGMPAEGTMIMKYTCDNMDMRFDQTGDHVIAKALFAELKPLSVKGVTHDNFFYGTNGDETLSGTPQQTQPFVVFRGFLHGNTLQMTVDIYGTQDKVYNWGAGGITTLYRQEEK